MSYAERKEQSPQGNVPNLRFPEFGGEWEKTMLSKVCLINPKTPELDDQFVYIDLESVEKGLLLCENIITKSEAPSRAQRVLNIGDILFQCVRPYQKNNLHFVCKQQDLQYVASTGYAQIRTHLDSKYLYQLLNTQKFIDQVMLRCTGSSYPAINSTDLSSIPIHIAKEIQEQSKISAILTLLDQRITTQIKIIEDLKKLKSAISNLHFDTAIVNYSLVSIGDCIEQLSQRNKNGKIKEVLSVSNKNGFVNQSEQFEDREIASEDTSNYKIVRPNDFAYNPARINVGSIARLHNYSCGIVSPMYVCFHTMSMLLPEYFEHFFSTSYFKHEMYKRLEGSVRLCLTYDSLCNIKIALPSINEQQQFVSQISAISSKIINEDKLLVLYQTLKQYLLAKMFI